MILVVDNYDSFTYNLVQMLGGIGAELEVVRNDVESVPELLARTASSCLRARAGPRRRAFASISCGRGTTYRSSASASGTRRWGRRSAAP